jgi:hypothetical protein
MNTLQETKTTDLKDTRTAGPALETIWVVTDATPIAKMDSLPDPTEIVHVVVADGNRTYTTRGPHFGQQATVHVRGKDAFELLSYFRASRSLLPLRSGNVEKGQGILRCRATYHIGGSIGLTSILKRNENHATIVLQHANATDCGQREREDNHGIVTYKTQQNLEGKQMRTSKRAREQHTHTHIHTRVSLNGESRLVVPLDLA